MNSCLSLDPFMFEDGKNENFLLLNVEEKVKHHEIIFLYSEKCCAKDNHIPCRVDIRKDTHTVARKKINFSLLLFYGPKSRKTETFITFSPLIRLGNGMK